LLTLPGGTGGSTLGIAAAVADESTASAATGERSGAF
jgi:hypothetical protein